MADDNELSGLLPAGAATPAASKIDDIPVQEVSTTPLETAKPETAAAEPEEEHPATEHEDGERRALTDDEKRIAQEAFAKRALQRDNKRLADELAALKAARSQSAPAPVTPNATDAEQVQANAPAGGFRTQAEFDAAVQQAAQARVAADVFNAQCNATFEKGVASYKDDFKGAVANLQSVGVMNRDVLDLVLATDDPAKVLFELGSDPDKASRLLDMTPAQRAIEVAKMAVTKKAPAPISNAPPPVKTVEGSARVSGEPGDDDDDAAWFAKRNAQIAARNRAMMGA